MRISHKARWKALRDDSLVRRCEDYARWTLAQLMVDLEQAALADVRIPVERDYQSMGALLVNNLGPKLASMLFPTGRPFYQIELAGPAMKEATEQHTKAEVQAQLARMEMDSCKQLFRNASFNQLVLGMKFLIVTGNALMYRDSQQKRSIAYGLQQYVTQRDGRGTLLDCVLREYTYFEALPQDVQIALRAANPARYGPTVQGSTTQKLRVELYTRIERLAPKTGNAVARYRVTQEADTTPIGDESVYPEHLCPWQALTWNLIPGEHYGRGLVEDYAGDFASMSDLSMALTLYGVQASKIVNLVQSGSGTDVDTLQSAETGEWVSGDPTTVNAYEAGDAKKIAELNALLQEKFQRLSRAFMYTGNTRDAERVTAYELALMAREVENTLGGVYSALAESWQIPLAHILLTEVEPGILKGIITKQVRLDIVAGIPALGRSSDVENLMRVAQAAAPIFTALSQVDRRVDMAKVMDLLYAGFSVDTSALFKTPEQLAKEKTADELQAQGTAQVQRAGVDAAQQQGLQTLLQSE